MRLKAIRRADATVISKKTKRKPLATLLAILFQPGRPREPKRPMLQAVRIVPTLYGPDGRKYLTSAERRRFQKAAEKARPEVRLFCLMLIWCGGRISEVLALRPIDIDLDAGTANIETLKKRIRGVVRQVPLPRPVLNELSRSFGLYARQKDPVLSRQRLWPWSRTTGWRRVKEMMAAADIHGACAMPKGIRHAFGVVAFQSVPPHLVQRWLGHASFRTTAIYGNVIGREERAFARRMWRR